MASTVTEVLELAVSSEERDGSVRQPSVTELTFIQASNSVDESIKEDGHLLSLDGNFGSASEKIVPAAVNKKTNVYSKTNWIIRNSRKYIPTKVLHEYVHFRCFKEMFYIIFGTQYTLLLLSTTFLSFINDFWPSLSTLQISCGVVALLLCVPVSVLLFQHLYVVFRTLPWVLSQPREQHLNELFTEISIGRACLSEMPQLKFASSFEKGIGIVENSQSLVAALDSCEANAETSDKVRFLVLSCAGVSATITTGVLSTVLMSLNCAACIWSLVIVILTAINITNQ